jgi:hypothetical protein
MRVAIGWPSRPTKICVQGSALFSSGDMRAIALACTPL